MQGQLAMLCWCHLASYTGCIWPYYASTVSFVVLPPIGHAKLALFGHVILALFSRGTLAPLGHAIVAPFGPGKLVLPD